MNDLLERAKSFRAVYKPCPACYAMLGDMIDAVERIETTVCRLQNIRLAAETLYQYMWMIAGSPLEIAAKYGPDFVPPDAKELENVAHAMRASLDAYNKAAEAAGGEGCGKKR